MRASKQRVTRPGSTAAIDPAPAASPAAGVRSLQRSHGNRAVGRWLAPLTARRAAAPGVVQRQVMVDPMPKMTAQVGKLGVLGVVDLNCGWYCEEALLAHWFEKLNDQEPQRLPLPRTKLYGYDPGEDHASVEAQQAMSKTVAPKDLETWEMLLGTYGPVIVSGKLGAADWGGIQGAPKVALGPVTVNFERLGVGHYVLVVGADKDAGTISYLDPLQGNRLRTGSFEHVRKRLDRDAYYLNERGAKKLLGLIGAE